MLDDDFLFQIIYFVCENISCRALEHFSRSLFRSVALSFQVPHLAPNVAQEISLCAIILPLLSDDGIELQVSLSKCSVFLLKCFECRILLLNRLLNSRVDALNFHLVLFVDALQFAFDLAPRLVLQVVLFSGELLAKL